MGKAKRKMQPEMPYWYLLYHDMVTGQCWFCKNQNNCNQCKSARSYLKEYSRKKMKGRHGEE